MDLSIGIATVKSGIERIRSLKEQDFEITEALGDVCASSTEIAEKTSELLTNEILGIATCNSFRRQLCNAFAHSFSLQAARFFCERYQELDEAGACLELMGNIAVPALDKLLESGNGEVLDHLRSIGTPFSKSVEVSALWSDFPAIRSQAAWSLAQELDNPIIDNCVEEHPDSILSNSTSFEWLSKPLGSRKPPYANLVSAIVQVLNAEVPPSISERSRILVSPQLCIPLVCIVLRDSAQSLLDFDGSMDELDGSRNDDLRKCSLLLNGLDKSTSRKVTRLIKSDVPLSAKQWMNRMVPPDYVFSESRIAKHLNYMISCILICAITSAVWLVGSPGEVAGMLAIAIMAIVIAVPSIAIGLIEKDDRIYSRRLSFYTDVFYYLKLLVGRRVEQKDSRRLWREKINTGRIVFGVVSAIVFFTLIPWLNYVLLLRWLAPTTSALVICSYHLIGTVLFCAGTWKEKRSQNPFHVFI